MIPRLVKQLIQEPLESLFGTAAARRSHHELKRRRRLVPEAIDAIQRRWKLAPDDDGDDPIFIFSAAWRSGSTLLQRLALSGDEALIWGEPYPYCDYVRTLAKSLTAIDGSTPPDQFFLAEPPGHRDVDFNAWTACMYPQPQHLRRAHRAFFQTLYRDPALARGYRRWGLKEVVLSTAEAGYLKWLFPASKLVFLIRNPYDAWRSYRSIADWYYRWPDQPVFTARQFGRLWKMLAEDFQRGCGSLDALVIRYEELISGGSVLDGFARHVATPVQASVARVRVTGRAGEELAGIPRIEIMQLRMAVDPLAARLGYAAPGR